jgi:hypothetical protein
MESQLRLELSQCLRVVRLGTSTVLGNNETRVVTGLVSHGTKLSRCWAVIGDFASKKKFAVLLAAMASSSIIKYKLWNLFEFEL